MQILKSRRLLPGLREHVSVKLQEIISNKRLIEINTLQREKILNIQMIFGRVLNLI